MDDPVKQAREARDNLIEVLARTYSREQLARLVESILGKQLDYYVIAPDMRATVSRLLDQLEPTPIELAVLLLQMRERSWSPEVLTAISTFLRIPEETTVAYQALEISGRPFVNRQILRSSLGDLFRDRRRQAMVTRGERAVGKTYSRLLIDHVARSERINTIHVDLFDLNQVPKVIPKIVNEMWLPVSEFRDRLAQYETQAKGFVEVLRGFAIRMADNERNQRWCIIFDSHDNEGVEPELRDLVDRLLKEVASGRLPGIWVVVLGHRPGPLAAVGPNGISAHQLAVETVQALTRPDVERFLQDLSSAAGTSLVPADLAKRVEDVFVDLAPPFDHGAMATFAERLCLQVAQLRG